MADPKKAPDFLSDDDLAKLEQNLPDFIPDEKLAEIESSQPDWLRSGLGFAKGVAEGLNPLAVPHGIESLLRATSRNPLDKRGFGERLNQASKDATIPNVSIDDIAVGLRAGTEVAGTLLKGNIPTKDEIKKIIEGQSKDQKSFNREFISPEAEAMGGLTVLGVSAGGALKDILKATKLSDKLGSFASLKSFQAIKPKGKFGKMLAASDRGEKIGRRLLDEEVMTSGASYKNILDRINEKLDNYGETIGHYSQNADLAKSRNSAIRGVLTDEIIQRANNTLIPQLIEKGASDVAQDVSNWMVKNLKPAGPTGELGFQQVQDIKQTISDLAKFNKANARDTSANAYKAVYHLVNDAHENGIEGALKTAGSTEDIKDFLKAKQAYRDLSDAEVLVSDTLGGNRVNRGFSLSDYLATISTPQLLKDTATAPAKVATSIGVGAINRLIRTRGNQIVSGASDTLSKAFKKDPQGFYKYAEGLRNVARKAAQTTGAINTIVPDEQTVEFEEPSVITPRKKK